MSSAANHRVRSHRSYSNKRSTMGKIQSNSTYRKARVSYIKAMRQRAAESLSKLIPLRKPRESKSDKA